MRKSLCIFVLVLFFAFAGSALATTTPTLGVAATYGVLSSTYINTSASTAINGDIGFTTSPAVTPLGTHPNYGSAGPYSAAGTAQAAALANLNGQGCTFTFDIGAVVLSTNTQHGSSIYTPGVYCIDGAVSIGSTITLSGAGTYIFRSTGALNAEGSSIVTLAGASADDVFWTPNGATTLNANSTFIGNVIPVSQPITLLDNVSWTGRALAFGGTVTTGSADTITVPGSEPTCEANNPQTIVSDVLTLQGANPTVIVSPIHSTWTVSIPDATWIWGENPIADAVNQTSETFTRTFTIVGTPTGATLDIATDNSYVVSVNGHAIGFDATEFNYISGGQDTYSIPASSLVSGVNVITFTVTNWAMQGGTMTINPAGLLYKLIVNSETCQTLPPPVVTATISATKIVCDNESDLPNWGAGDSTLQQVTSNTVSRYLSTHESCRIAEWNFEWAPDGTNNPGDNIGVAGSPWTPFTSTVTIPAGSKTWVREQANSNYIPFSSDTNGSDGWDAVSAEMYCSNDTLNYDNYDYIDPVAAGSTYYCVAFNVLKKAPSPQTLKVHIFKYLENGDSISQIPNDSTLAPFPMVATWNATNIGAGTGNYVLGNSHGQPLLKYAADTIDMSSPADYTTSEVTDVSSNFLPANASCEAGKFRLVGYKDGNSLSEAQSATITTTAPVYTGLTSDKYEIVVNEQCPELPPPAVCNADTELINNGSFENPTVTNSALWDIFNFGTTPSLAWLASWIDSTDAPQVANVEIQKTGLNGWNASSGIQWAELDGDWFGPSNPSLGHPAVAISQDIVTIPSDNYTVSFDFSPRPSTADTENKVEVLANNVLIGTVGPTDGTSLSNTAWTSHSFNFTAASALTTITLRDAGTPNDSLGTFVDNVSAKCVPAEKPTTGTIQITKYECPADTVVTRDANGVKGTHPEGCTLETGATFGYVHGTQTDANAPYPELTATLTAGGTTNDSGVLTITDLPADGRYLVVETDSSNTKIPAGDILGLYCEGDGDTSGNNDNQELTFVPAGGVTHCVAYNKAPIDQVLLGDLHAQDFGVVNYDTGLGILKGYTSGWGLTDTALASTTSVVVQLFAAEDVLLQTNTAIMPAFSNLPGVQFTSPFDVSGTFNYGADGYWTNVRQTEFGQSVPAVKVVATVTLANGKILTAQNTLLTGEPTTIFQSVITKPATDITTTSATINGTNGPVNADNTSFWLGTTSAGSFTSATDPTSQLPSSGGWAGVASGAQSASAAFSYAYTSLLPNTTYYFAAWSQVGGTWYPGAVLDFTTTSLADLSQNGVSSGSRLLSTTFAANGSPVGLWGMGGDGSVPEPSISPVGEVLGVSCGLYMDKHIRLGSSKNDSEQVKKLQGFLNKWLGSNIPITGFYGPLTFAKVKEFQAKYGDDVLKPWNLNSPTGIVYLSTLRKINNLECPDIMPNLPALVNWSSNPNAQ